MLGAKHFVAARLAAGVDGAIVCEPEGGEICTVAKGALRLRVDLTGKMAHGAMPQHGRNPIQAVGAAADRAAGAGARPAGAPPRARAPRRGVRDPDRAPRRRPRSRSTSSPPTASVCIDVRTIPGLDHRRCRRVAVAAEARLGRDRRRGVRPVDRPPVDVARRRPAWWPRSPPRTATSPAPSPSTAAFPVHRRHRAHPLRRHPVRRVRPRRQVDRPPVGRVRRGGRDRPVHPRLRRGGPPLPDPEPGVTAKPACRLPGGAVARPTPCGTSPGFGSGMPSGPVTAT